MASGAFLRHDGADRARPGPPWTGRGLDVAGASHRLCDLALVVANRRGAPMKIVRAKDYADMSRKAANLISAQVILKPD